MLPLPLSICLSSISLSPFLSICLSPSLYLSLAIYLSLCLSLSLSATLYVSLYLSALSICPSMYPLAVYLYLCPLPLSLYLYIPSTSAEQHAGLVSHCLAISHIFLIFSHLHTFLLLTSSDALCIRLNVSTCLSNPVRFSLLSLSLFPLPPPPTPFFTLCHSIKNVSWVL